MLRGGPQSNGKRTNSEFSFKIFHQSQSRRYGISERKSRFGRKLGILPLQIIFLVLILTTSLSSCDGFCPTKCICDDSELHTSVECSNTNLELIPFLLNPNVRILKLPSNKIVAIGQSLAFYSNVEYLELSTNLISSIEVEDLQAQTKLTVLKLSDNKIVTIKNGTLDSMGELKELYLENNLISSVEARAFKSLSNLIVLDLTKNNLKSISDETFASAHKLETLKLNYNRFQSVPSNAVKNMNGLKTLEIIGNYLSQVNAHAFETLPSLGSLSLDKNNISVVQPGAFDGLINLVSLSIKDNRLTNVHDVSFQSLAKLEVLDLSGNLFQVIGKDSFSRAPPSLLHLHLTRCPRLTRVSSNAFLSLTSLRTLKLSHNARLVHLGASVFSSLLQLTDLDLTACGLVHIHPKQMPQGQKTQLHLAGNPLHCNCSLLWLAQFQTNSSNYLDTPTCATPPNLYGVPVSDVDPRAAGCPHHLSLMAIAVCIGVVILGILIIAIFLACRWRKSSTALNNKDMDLRFPPPERPFRELYRDPTSELVPVPTPIFAPKYQFPCQNDFPRCMGDNQPYHGGYNASLGSQPPYSLHMATHPLLSPTSPSPSNASQIPVEWQCPNPYEDDSVHWYTTIGRDGREYLTGELKRNIFPPPLPKFLPPEPPQLPPSPPMSVRLQRKASSASHSASTPSHPASPILPTGRHPSHRGRLTPIQVPNEPLTYI